MATRTTPAATETAGPVAGSVRLLARALAVGRTLVQVAPQLLETLAEELGDRVELTVGSSHWEAGSSHNDAAVVPIEVSGDAEVVLRVPPTQVSHATVMTCVDLLAAMSDRTGRQDHPSQRRPLLQVARELQRRREQLRQLLETAPVGIMFVDLDGALTYANTAAHRILRVPAGTLTGRLHEDPRFEIRTLEGAPIPTDQRVVPYVIRTGRSLEDVQCRVSCADGSDAVVSVNASPLRAPDGALTGVVIAYADVTSLDQARRTAQEREARVSALLRQVPGYLWTVGPDLRLRSHEGQRPDPRSPTAGAHLREAFDLPEDAPAVRHHQRALAGEAATYEHWLEDRCFKVRVEPTYAPDGRIDGAIGVSIDVTDLRAGEHATRHLAALVESADHAIYSVELDGTIRSWNRGAERLFGWPVEDAVGADVRAILPPDVDEPDTRGVADGHRYTFETTRRRRDGTVVAVSITVSPIADPDGRVVGASVLASDISDQVEAQRALAFSERRFRELAERSEDVIYLARVAPDGSTTMEYMNPATERVTGVPVEVITRAPEEIDRRIHPDDLAALHGRSGTGTEPETTTLRFLHADGRWIYLERTRIPILAGGRLVAVHGILRDVSRREATERALRDALSREEQAVQELHALDQLKSSFLQAVSHELRTPLTAVVGLAHTVEDHLVHLPPERLRELTGRLRANAVRLERLLADLLDLERLTRGEFRLERTDADLAELVEGVLEVVDTDGRALTADLEPVRARVEPRLVERIVENLVRNAAKHTPEGTRIVVRLRPDDDAVVIRVDDDGPGVPEDLRERIFAPFEQGPQSRSSASPGTGVGLSLVQRFAQLHGGTAWVTGSPLGGASFGVRLPSDG